MNMKKLTLIIATSSALLFTACKEEKVEAPAEATTLTVTQKAVAKTPAKPAVKVDEGTKFELTITNGHLGKVILGINENATDGYDRGLDDMAPPPGMETGYTALVSPDKKYLYRDTRKPAKEIEWIFRSKVYKEKAVVVSWDIKTIPADYNFDIQQGETNIDMRKQSSITIPTDDAIIITAYAVEK